MHGSKPAPSLVFVSGHFQLKFPSNLTLSLPQAWIRRDLTQDNKKDQKQPPGWWEVSNLIFPANRKVKYLVLPFGSDPFVCFSAFIKHCCVGKRLKEEYQLSFSVQSPIQKRHPGLQEPKCVFKCFWQKKSARVFPDCSLSGEMDLCGAGEGKAAVFFFLSFSLSARV